MSRRQQTTLAGIADRRGNSRDRAARKQWMLDHFGDGHTAACVHCGTALTYATVQADRICPGGSYRRANIRPSCARDNIARGDNAAWVSPWVRQLLSDLDSRRQLQLI